MMDLNSRINKKLADGPEDGAPVLTRIRTSCWNMDAARTGRRYRIMAAIPEAPPPAAGYPVLYLLDADHCFGTASEAVRLQTKGVRGYDAAVVVGIGYPVDRNPDHERFYDYTPPTSVENLPVRKDGSPWPALGGAEAFADFLDEELKPRIEAMFPTDAARTALMGHSLGGLFVLHLLFTRSGLFRTYLAGSPSIWWNNASVLDEADAFVKNRDADAPPAVLLLVSGELEREVPSRIGHRARELAEELGAAAGRTNLKVMVQEFAGEGHVSVIPAFISRGIRTALTE